MTESEARELAWANYEYRDGCLYSTTYHDGFNAGVAYAEGQWVRCDERLPDDAESGYYFATRKTESGRVYTWQTHFSQELQSWSVTGNEHVIAWRPLPEPYTGESK